MTTTDFTTTLLTPHTPGEIFTALNNVRGWWSEEIEGHTDQLNEVFTYHYKDVHYCKIKLIELIPDKKVTWLIADNYFNFTKDKTEWIGTTISFDITEQDKQTQLRFTHHGLVPAYECFGVCKEAWTNYINNSLGSLISTGKGQPNPKEGEGYNAQLAKKWKLQ
jgi:hypothetical protein